MKVVIIGAGMAGLAAAAHLEQNGLKDYLILEARDTIGGRFFIQNHGKHTLHMGAQWVHGIGLFSHQLLTFASVHTT